MAALLHDVFISCVSACAVPLLFIHIYVGRESFQSIQSWCLRNLQCARAQYLQLCHRAEAGDQKDVEQVRRMVDEARVRNFKSFARFGIIVLAFISTALVRATGSKYHSMLAYFVTLYATGLLVAYSDIQWTPTRMTAITTFVHFMLLARTCTIQDPGVWFLNSGNRVLFRLFIGMSDMDHRKVATWNVLFLIANVIKQVKMSASFPALQLPLSGTLISEGLACTLIWVTSYVAQRWITDCVRAAFEASTSRLEKTMTGHLLSAFCDVQVKLGPNLEILSPHEKLKHILLVSSSGCEFHHGTSFLDYVASGDKARFKAFIEASSAPADRNASTSSEDFHERLKIFPSALHVHMRNSFGHYLPASIFLSPAMIADGESHHLIGICVESSEQSTDAQEVFTDSAARQHGPRAFAKQANQDCQPDQDCHDHESPKKDGDSLSSRSSSTSSKSKKSQYVFNLDWVESLSVVFDPFEWSIHRICWNLSDVGQEELSLVKCMLQPHAREFRAWVQDRVNNVLFAENDHCAQECQSVMYGSMTLTLPQALNSKKQMVLSATSAWLDLEELDEVDDHENARVSLRLEGVQEISSKSRGRSNAVMSTICE